MLFSVFLCMTGMPSVCGESSQGAGGVDDVVVEELGDYIKEHWNGIREQIRHREYNPQPVRRVEIPKPNGGVPWRKISTLLTRVLIGVIYLVEQQTQSRQRPQI